jgi:hypothetical protein
MADLTTDVAQVVVVRDEQPGTAFVVEAAARPMTAGLTSTNLRVARDASFAS